ncbi:AaceriAFR560Wp [[Ashbya] aceris (nom. inval.)]|nr:AaceriAFR560Wp [[Ashbya] aceris (nom. inval.)]
MPQSQGIERSPFSFYAFYQLYAYFHKDAPAVTFDAVKSKLYHHYPMASGRENEHSSVFITWKKRDERGEYQLRGCIGTFAKLPLLRGIEKYSLIAALQDSRFPPIEAGELARLKCSCNVLSRFKTVFEEGAGDIYDWKVGRHGVILRFRHPTTGRTCSATFLPEVMVEQGWSQLETFENLIEKAGCWQHVDELMDNYDRYFIEVITYRGDKSEISYDDFVKQLKAVQKV